MKAKKSVKKVAKKVAKKTVKKVAKKTGTAPKYSKKELQEIAEMMARILTNEEASGLVLVAEDVKNKIKTLGGMRNMSNAQVMAIVLKSLHITAIEGAILCASIKSYEDRKK